MTDSKTAANRPLRWRRQRAWNRFLLTALALHIPVYFYPILRLCDWLELPWWLTLVVFLPIASSQIVSRVYLRGATHRLAIAYRKLADFWLGLSPIVLMTLLVFEVVVLLSPISTFDAALWVLGISSAVGILGVVTAMIPFVKRIRFDSHKLSNPLRFVQITDVHIGSRSRQFLESIVRKINKLEPEFVCITGDFIDASGIQESELVSLKSIECPIYFCIGNHEKYEDLDDILTRLRNLGVNILRNDTLHHNHELQVIGIDDLDDPDQVGRELAGVPIDANRFVLLLYHRPRGLEAAAAAGIDLMLSGHTHNGQIMPFNFVVSRVFDKIEGMYRDGATRLYVSQGTGTWGPVMRVGTRSEITLFEIAPSN